MKKQICEIMDKDVYTCDESQTLEDVVKILVDKKVGGLPIVDKDNHVIGFISDGDIMKTVSKQKTRSFFSGDSTMVLYDENSFEEKVAELKNRNVMELATRKVTCARPEQPIDEVANILSQKKIKKMPVVDKNNILIGTVRRATVMRYIFSVIFDLSAKDKRE